MCVYCFAYERGGGEREGKERGREKGDSDNLNNREGESVSECVKLRRKRPTDK